MVKYVVDETWGEARGQEDEESTRNETRKSDMDTPNVSVCQPSKKQVTSKKKMKNDDILSDLVGDIHEYVTALKEANEEIKGISTYFRNKLRAVIEEWGYLLR